MAFGLYHPSAFSSHPFFYDDIFFDDFAPFSFGAGARHRRVHPRRSRVAQPLAPHHRGSWRRALSHHIPSVFDYLDYDFDRALERFLKVDRDAEEVPAALEAPKTTKAITAAAPTTQTESAVTAPAKSQHHHHHHHHLQTSPRLGALSVRKAEDKSTVIEVQMPGLSKDDIKLDFDFKHHSLNIKAEHKAEEKDDDGRVTSYRHVSFSRSFPIPSGAAPEDVKADFTDGVLHISIAPKQIEAAPQPESTSLPIADSSSSSPKLDKAISSNAVSSVSSETSSTTSNDSTSSTPASETIDDRNSATVEDAE